MAHKYIGAMLSSTLAEEGIAEVGAAPTAHTHAAADVTGTAMTLESDDVITGKKTFPFDDGTNAPVFRGDSSGPIAALKLYDLATGGTLDVVGAVPLEGALCTLVAGVVVTGSEANDLCSLGTGLVKNTTTTGNLTIATKSDLPGHDHTAAGEGGVIDYATEEYVNNAVAQVINVASGRTLTVGTETSGTYASTHVHDNTPWRVREAAATPGLNVELTFGATTAIAKAPTALWLRAYHNGEHTITVSIYKYTTAAWESYQVLPEQQSSYTFYSIPIPDSADHISAGLARVQFAYTGEGSSDDYLYVDYCALVKGGQGSETVDATRTWTTKQTFPGDAYAPEMGKIELGHATDTTLTRTGAGDIAVEGNHIYRAGGTDVAVADGGTGASTLAEAGIPQKLATWSHTGIASAGGGGWHTIAAATAPAGYYRLSFYSRLTTGGSIGDYLLVALRGYEGASRTVYVPGPSSVGYFISGDPGAPNALAGSMATNTMESGSVIIYHDGTATKAVDWTYNLALGGNGPPDAIFSLYTVAEYLGE